MLLNRTSDKLQLRLRSILFCDKFTPLLDVLSHHFECISKSYILKNDKKR